MPAGARVLVNGFFTAGEWNDAAVALAVANYRVLVKRDTGYLFIAVVFAAQKHTGLDASLRLESGECLQFHISSALGTRAGGPGGWGELSWRPEAWSGNAIGTIVAGGRMHTLEPDGFELQIDRSVLTASRFSLRIDLKRPAVVLPPSSGDCTAAAAQEWIGLSLEAP